MRLRTMLATMTVATAVAGACTAASGQDRGMPVDVASRGPLFLARGSGASGMPAGQWVDVSNAAIFRRRITVNLRHVSRERALAEITRRGGLRLTYSAAAVRLDVPVTLVADDITVGAALSAVLYDAGVDVMLTENGRAALVRRTLPLVIQQHGTIAGQVTDSATHRGIGGAEVFLSGTPWRTTTDTAGHYRLAEVDTGGYALTVRRLGYAKQSRRVVVRDGQEDTVDVALAPVATRLNELVTTATGPRRRLDIANDVTTINADSVMQAAPVASVTDLLEHRVPGLTVQRTSGAPGDPARLRLRGASSVFRNNDPIVVVDGVRFYGEQSAARSANLASRDTTGTGFATPSPLDYIDPNSIETIEVLKGPSAATLYGQDAANGVIIITTKRGKVGPTRWAMSAQRGRHQMAGEYPTLLFGWGHTFYDHVPVYCPLSALATCQPDSLVPFQFLSDPALTVLDRGDRTITSLTASGGTTTLTYAITGSYRDELGLVRLPDYEVDRYQTLLKTTIPDWMRRPERLKQWGVTSNIGAKLGEKASVTLTTEFSRTTQQRSPLEDQLGELMTTYLDRSSGTYYRASSPAVGSAPAGVVSADQLVQDYYTRITDRATQFTNGLNLNWRPRSWLTVTGDAGLNVIQRTDQQYLPREADSLVHPLAITNGGAGKIADGQGTSVVSTVNLRSNALAPLGHGFQFRFAAGVNYAGKSTNDITLGTKGLPPGSSLEGAQFDFRNRQETSDVTFGWYAEPSVGNSKFNFSSGLRLDGGKTYGGNVGGLSLPKFPKLGFSYLVSDEPWFPLKDLVQSLRVRMAYGRASRQPGPKDRLRLYSDPSQVYTTGGDFATGVNLATLGNTELRPERSAEFEGGFDADLWDSRITVSVTGYRKTTDDALMSMPVAPSVYGTASILKNIGVIRNTGLEFDVGAQLIRSDPLIWQAQVQFSQRRDLVVKLGPGVLPFYTDGQGNTGGSGLRIVEGYPPFGRWSRPIIGYADDNGNGVLEAEEIVLGDSAVYVGSTLPNYTLDMHTTVALWRGTVTLNAGLAYEDGLAQRNTTAQQLARFAYARQAPTAGLAEQAVVALLEGSDYNWIQTISTFRFDNLSIQYTIPEGVARRLGAEKLNLAIQGSNLGLWTNYRGLDPDVNGVSTGNNVMDSGTLPLPRTWLVRISATY